MGVHQQAVRHRVFFEFVVIRNDHIQAQFFRVGHFLAVRAAAVYGNEQLRALFRDASHGVLVKPVPVGEPRRNVKVHPLRQFFQDRIQQRGGRYPVRVVVAVDADGAPIRSRLQQFIRRCGQIRQQFRVVGAFGRCREEIRRVFRRADAPALQNAHNRSRDPFGSPVRQCIRLLVYPGTH